MGAGHRAARRHPRRVREGARPAAGRARGFEHFEWDGRHCDLVWAIPAYADEAALVRAWGIDALDALDALVDRHEHGLADVTRPSLCEAVRMLVIDAANVIGSRPTGWWRDRPGAARTFVERVRVTAAAGLLDRPVTVVLEGQARAGADEADADGVAVVHARGEGDDTIAAIAEASPGAVVVTADRGLAGRVRAAGGEVVGPNWLLEKLVD